MNIPVFEYGGKGSEIIFLHANGYPPACYIPLFAQLSSHYHITAMLQRPLWCNSQPQDLRDWFVLSDDLLDFITFKSKGATVCIGHSMGGIAILRAALRFPDKFSAIILLDPVLFPPYVIRISQLLHALRLESRTHPLVPIAKKRRRQFDDLEKLFRGYRRKSVFRYMDDASLQYYVKGISCPSEEGYRLCYSPEWESRIYTTSAWHDMDIWRGLHSLNIPTMILRGAETDTFWSITEKLVKRRNSNIKTGTITNATHLVPLEQPGETARLIHAFLEDVL